MANQSEKKSEQNRIQIAKFYRTVLLIVTVFYLVCTIFSAELTSWKTWAVFGFFSLVNFITYRGIDGCLSLGLTLQSYSTYNDIFIVNTFVQFTSCFSSWFWLVYLVVPGYILYYVLKYCWGYVSNINYDQSDSKGDKNAKDKKDKKEKIKYKKVK